MEEKISRLINLVTRRTRDKSIAWSRGSSENNFRAEFEAAILSIELYIDEYGAYFVTLNMYNGTGDPITLASARDGSEDFNVLWDLYVIAKDSYTKESETIDNLLKELGGF